MYSEILIVGQGGIGSILSDVLCKFISFSHDGGTESPYPKKVILMDGDSYERKNLSRQFFHHDLIDNFKSEAKALELEDRYGNLEFVPVVKWANADTLKELNLDKPIILGCVDNHKTRKILSDFAQTFDDVLYISGGNEITTGNIQIYMKKGGEAVSHTIEQFHPEIGQPKDKSPEELGCEQLAVSQPQLVFANMWAALLMACAIYNVMEGHYEREEGSITIFPEETWFDLTTSWCMPKYRALSQEMAETLKKLNLV